MENNTDNNNKIHNTIIIGSGPAGLTAGIYLARADLEPLILAGAKFGGQLMQTTDIENFPGFPKGLGGAELMNRMIQQAERFGSELIYQDVTKVELQTEVDAQNLPVHKIFVGDKEYKTHSVVVATGAVPRKLNIPGESEYWGKGVSSCATCDGAFYRQKTVAVVGGGDSAMEEATFLTKFAERVYIIHRRDEFRASKIMQDRAFANPKIEVIWNTNVKEIKGDGTVESLILENSVNEEKSELQVDGLFLAIGYIPETELFSDYLEVDSFGYVKPQDPHRTNTTVPGVFVAGDVEDDYYRQAITAAGDGCRAALDAERWLASFE
jgi:thioredoxin reductase (NADPH)